MNILAAVADLNIKNNDKDNNIIPSNLIKKAERINTMYNTTPGSVNISYIGYEGNIIASSHKDAYILGLVNCILYYHNHIPGDSIEYPMCKWEIYNPFERDIGVIEKRNFHKEYAEKFFQAIWQNKNLEELKEELGKINPNAIKYLVEFENDGRTRNTLYGPRIHSSINDVLEELKENKYSRRAWIQILENEDNKLLKPLREKRTTIEYPCAVGFGFQIRTRDNEDYLDMNVILRSNNLSLTICYDFYNFTRLFEEVYNILKEKYPQLKVGIYRHLSASAHIFEKEFELIENIFDEVIEKNLWEKN